MLRRKRGSGRVGPHGRLGVLLNGKKGVNTTQLRGQIRKDGGGKLPRGDFRLSTLSRYTRLSKKLVEKGPRLGRLLAFSCEKPKPESSQIDP